MVVKSYRVSIKLVVHLCASLLFINLNTAFAQKFLDSSKKHLLASLEKSTGPRYINKPGNVVFPEILKGNEAETLDYIESFSTNRRDYLLRMYSRGKKLLPKAAMILGKYDLPAELKLLMTLESAYNGNAISKAGAVGYWQIMDEVAKEYGMKYVARLSKAEKKILLKAKTVKAGKKNKKAARLVDDRKNFLIATHTAARYLRDRRRNLSDNWLLVVASYNCGVGNVWNAIKRSGKKDPGFWDIQKYLPAETRAYVMNFVTLNVIFHNYELFEKKKLSFTPVKIMLPQNIKESMAKEIDEPIPRSLK